MKILITIIVILIVAFGAYYFFWKEDIPKPAITSFEECVAAGNPVMESYPRQCRAGDKNFIEEIALQYKDIIRIDSPKSGEKIANPVKIEGQARGNWYFEASFPLEIIDEDGTVLAQVPIQAVGEWMTTDYTTFRAEVPFKQPKGNTGKIIFHKDNPSGLPENDDSVTIPIRFK
jgi:hypothetical protein